MSIQTALVFILSCLAVWLYLQTRADKARRELVRLAAYEHWSHKTFQAVKEILYIEGFPSGELTQIYNVVNLIDQKSAATSLYMIFNHKDRPTGVMDQESLEFFESNKIADEAYMEFFYSSMMAISYLDNWGDLVRPKIEELKNKKTYKAMELSEDIRESHWPLPIDRAAA